LWVEKYPHIFFISLFFLIVAYCERPQQLGAIEMKHGTREETIREAIDIIFSQINANDDLVLEIFKKNIPYQHRTLIQSFFRTFNDFSIYYADNQSDLRNEDSIAFCKKLKKLDHFFRYI